MPHTTNRSHARCLCDAGSVSGVAEVALDQNVKHSWIIIIIITIIIIIQIFFAY